MNKLSSPTSPISNIKHLLLLFSLFSLFFPIFVSRTCIGGSGQAQLDYGGFDLGSSSIWGNQRAGPKNVSHFKSGQKWLTSD